MAKGLGADAQRELRDSMQWYLAFLLIGGSVVSLLVASGAQAPDPGSRWIFLRMVALGELPQVAIHFVFVLGIALATGRSEVASVDASAPQHVRPVCLLSILVVTIAVSVAVAIGVLGRVPLSMDEYVGRLQARIFLSGRMVGLPPELPEALVDAARPVFVFPTGDGKGWVSGYLPTFSMLLTPFEYLNVSWLLNPVLNCVSVWAVFSLARSHWSNEPENAVVAALVLATSSQFIAAAGTTYAMSAHLTAGLLWLLSVRSSGRLWLAAGPLSLIALTLHQPVPHVLFAAPFLIRMLRERQIRKLAYLAPWYVAAVAGLVFWSGLMSGRLPTFGSQGLLYWPNSGSVLVLLLSVLLSMTWTSPICTLLMVSAMRSWRRMASFERDLLLGILASLFFYLFFRHLTQGHGWGWRYGHQVLGNIALLSAAGWQVLVRTVGRPTALRLGALSLILTVFAQWPLHANLMRRLNEPFAHAHAWLQRQDATVIQVPVDSVWYGRDLIRNEANLTPPIIIPLGRIADSVMDSLMLHRQGRILKVKVSDLELLGLERVKRDTTHR